MDKWVHSTAQDAQKRGASNVHVCTHPKQGVLAFFTLSSHTVKGIDVHNKHCGGLTIVPATLLGRMGRHVSLRPQKPGAALLMEAFKVSVLASKAVASRLIVVDAKNERLAQWYEEIGFRRTTADPLCLTFKMSSARQAVEHFFS
ncbi:hypothetical protein [Mycobacteroides abscessus]|uniref:hypothetical protein n=1 Tax=Mycobacteroides abscessus TaxID=36809 RepID=UPI00177F1A59|nr:hypothetical protein [Mycobacteroides abscessus]